MNEPTPVAGEHADVARPLEITTFYSPETPLPRPEPRLLRTDVASRKLEEYRGVAIALFLATCLSVFCAGLLPGSPAGSFGALLALGNACLTRHFADAFVMLKDGAIYFGSLMAILGAHEMGHYLQARRYKVPATFPFFIPIINF